MNGWVDLACCFWMKWVHSLWINIRLKNWHHPYSPDQLDGWIRSAEFFILIRFSLVAGVYVYGMQCVFYCFAFVFQFRFIIRAKWRWNLMCHSLVFIVIFLCFQLLVKKNYKWHRWMRKWRFNLIPLHYMWVPCLPFRATSL